MEFVEYLVVGAGVSGLSFANWIFQHKPGADVIIVESDAEPGGYCKTVVQDGFVWDYAGHFFHFRRPEIEVWLRERMVGQDIRTVVKRATIRFAGRDIDFPFQKNIHQLPREDFIDCLVSLYFRDEGHDSSTEPSSFREMLLRRFGAGICERFLFPYNEKLYACDLDTLDANAMGRFFPHADIDEIIRNMKVADNSSYNATFAYPAGGAIQYINALLADLPPACIRYNARLEKIDLANKRATTTAGEFGFQHLISSAPFPRLLEITGVEHDRADYTCNKVLVYNLGFDRKGPSDVHWCYFPERDLRFYRVGFYDNIMETDRMSLYVEVGLPTDAPVDIEAERIRVLDDLQRAAIVADQQLVSWHAVVLDPAYVHITGRSMSEHARIATDLAAKGVHTVGRYGGWTYCSIEDNMIETQELAKRLAAGFQK